MCFWKKNFSHFFPTIFWSRYSCVYKKRFFALIPDDFFSIVLARDIRVFLKKKISGVFLPPFFVTIFVFIKKVFSHFFRRFFSIDLCSRYACVSRKNFFSRFFSRHFWSQFSCIYKKRVFALSRRFLSIFFARDIRVFLENFFLAFLPPFLVTIFMCL